MLLVFNERIIKKLHPKQMKKLLNKTRSYIYSCHSKGIYETQREEMLFGMLKRCLSELPQIPDKKAAKLIRRLKSKKS